jgi:asparagine synthase (glutamine-hydrolysing)
MPYALKAMGYRGADGFQGMETRGGWVLGHVRLAIQTDADFGAQPFNHTDEAFAFVGEIFARDLHPLTGLDEESVLTQALRSPNLRDFMRLDGFWNIAEIRDNGSARVLTDHLGVKPVYYWAEQNIFCSEIQPMFQLAPAPEFDEIYLSNCIKFGYDYSGRTPWKGISQVAPGTAMIYDRCDDRFEPVTYWDWNKVSITRPDWPLVEDASTALRRLLFEVTLTRASAVRHRTMRLLLSGGLDSSILYAILRENGLLNEVEVFSVENGESEFLPPGVTLLPDVATGGTSELRDAAQIMQAPLDLGSLLPQVRLSDALASKHARVCMTGDGADELFGGYSRAKDYDSQASDVFCELPYYHLPRLDRVHMRNTTEIRSPFLAPSVVAFALRLPRHERTGKKILKEAFRGLVPDAIIDRPKHPLKGSTYLENPLAHRAQLAKVFRDEFRPL